MNIHYFALLLNFYEATAKSKHTLYISVTAFRLNRSWPIWFHQLHWHFKRLLSARAAQDYI